MVHREDVRERAFWSFWESSRPQMLHVSFFDLRVPKGLPGPFIGFQSKRRLYLNQPGRDVTRFFQSPEANQPRDQNPMIGSVQGVLFEGHPSPLHGLLKFALCVVCEVQKHVEAEKILIERRKT